jgi:polyisoprenoid-binding protein YceI
MAQEKWSFDPVHSDIGFSVRHLMISKVRGHFQKWSGTLLIDEADLANSKVEVTIEAASINTKEQQRDEHLRSPDFFDAANHPALTFQSARVEKASEDEYKVTGDLTIRGVTREVVLTAEYLGRSKDPWGGVRMGFSAKTAIDRGDFGLKFNMPLEGGGMVVGDRVEITLEIEAVKEVPAMQAA